MTGGHWPSISVVIPAYNAARFLPSTLESVLAQSYPGRSWRIPRSTASSRSGPPERSPRSRRFMISGALAPCTSGHSTSRRGCSRRSEDGEIDFAIDQQQYLQGYLPVVLLTLYIETGTVPGGGHAIPTGPGFVTIETAQQVMDLTRRGVR